MTQIQTICLAPENAIQSGAVEKGVLPLVQALNHVEGVKTRASCQGHIMWSVLGTSLLERPYVLFSSSFKYAAGFDRKLVEACQDNILTFNWSLSAYFDQEHRPNLFWIIKLSTSRRIYPWHRFELDRDLLELSRLCVNESDPSD